jgi:hypothetical protein
MKALAAVLTMFALAGCESMLAVAQKPETPVRSATPIAKIDVRSIPTRCIVELNNEYLGITPLEVVVDATESGNWASQGFGSVFVMRCSTLDGEAYEQKVWYPGNPVPKRVLFRIPGAVRSLAYN